MNPKNPNADNIPKLRFPEFKGEWERKKLGEVAEIGRGKSKHRPRDADFLFGGKYPFIQTGDVRKAELYLTEFTQTYSEEGLKQSKLWDEDTLCITIAANIAETAILKIKACFPDSVIGLIPKQNQTIVLFVKHLFDKFKIQIQTLSQGAAQDNLNQEKLSNIEFVFPTLPEQKRIASFFTILDKKIAELKQKKSLLEQYKKGVMQRLFLSEAGLSELVDEQDGISKKNPKILKSSKSRFRQLRFKDENGKEFPKWEKKNGGELFESISNKNHNSDLPILAISQEFGAVPRGMINYQISVTDKSVESYKVVDVGDFIISLRSFQGGIEYSNYKGICSPAYVILRSTAPINNTFYKYYFKTDFYIQKLCEKLEGIRDGKMISYKYFSEIELPYPSLAEQTKIANFLSAIDEKINRTESQIQQTQTWKKGLLQKMFV
jgi:type I restriction enzyme, S subunit